MNYSGRLLLILLSGIMFSCAGNDFTDTDDPKDNPNINSGDATIGFRYPDLPADERASVLSVPIDLTGEHNGDVRFNVVLKEVHGKNVIAHETVVLSSNDVIMSAGISSVELKVHMSTATPEVDEGRYFVLELTSVEGAKLSTSTMRISLKESENWIEKLEGKWQFSAPNGNKQVYFQFVMSGIEVYPSGLVLLACNTDNFNDNGIPAKWKMYVESNGRLSFVLNDPIATGIDFGVPEWGLCSVSFGHFKWDENNKLSLGNGMILGTLTPDCSRAEFPTDDILGTWIYDEKGTNTNSIWTLYEGCSLMRLYL